MDDTSINILEEFLRKELVEHTDILSPAIQQLGQSKDWSTTIDFVRRKSQNKSRLFLSRLYSLDALWRIVSKNAAFFSLLAGPGSTKCLNDIAEDNYLIRPSGDGITVPDNLLSNYRLELFNSAPTAVLKGLVKCGNIPVSNSAIKAILIKVFDFALSRDFDIRSSSSKEVLEQFQEHEDIDESSFNTVAQLFQTIQRLQAVAVIPEEVGKLVLAKYDSAARIAQAKWVAFENKMKAIDVPEEHYRRIRDEAEIITARNEQAWLRLLATRTQGLQPADTRSSADGKQDGQVNLTGKKISVKQLSLENLFKEMDDTACEKCCSVISPGAYYVDLLKMLQDITFEEVTLTGSPSLGKDSETTKKTVSLLQKLFERRPDLGDLQLSCVNTDTLLPYLTIVNEVMGSFVRFLHSPKDRSRPSIEAVNCEEIDNSSRDSSSFADDISLYQDILVDEVFPSAVFPYNFETHYTRVVLQSIGRSRSELLHEFRSDLRLLRKISASHTESTLINDLICDTYERALAAEAMNLTLEDFIIITHQAFHSQPFLEVEKGYMSLGEYRTLIGLPQVCQLWGFQNNEEMLSKDESSTHIGLTFIQEQLLPRSGITFHDLLTILRTRFLGCRLIISSASQTSAFSGKTSEMRLKSAGILSTTTDLTVGVLDDLQAFIRLYQKSKWTIEDLDVALSTLQRQDDFTRAENPISPDHIIQLAAMSKMAEITQVDIKSFLTLWGDIDIHGHHSLFHNLFVANAQPNEAELFVEKKGVFFSDSAQIHEASNTLKASMDLTDNDLANILHVTRLKTTDTLKLSSLSQIYRHTLVCTLLNLETSDLKHLITLIDLKENLFKNAVSALKFVLHWKRLLSVGWTVRDILFVSRAVDPCSDYDVCLKSPEMINRAALDLWKGSKIIKDDLKMNLLQPDTNFVNLVLEKATDSYTCTALAKLLGGSMNIAGEIESSVNITVPVLLRGKLQSDRVPGQLSRTIVRLQDRLDDNELQIALSLSPEEAWKKTIRMLNGEVEVLANPLSLSNPTEREEFWKMDLTGRRRCALAKFVPTLELNRCREMVLDVLMEVVKDLDRSSLETVLGVIFEIRRGSKDETMSALEALACLYLKSVSSSAVNKAYFVPPVTNEYSLTFQKQASDCTVLLNGATVKFSLIGNDFTSEFFTFKTDGQYLISGNFDLNALSFRSRSPDQNNPIPSHLLPANVFEMFTQVLRRLSIIQCLITRANINILELKYFTQHPRHDINVDYMHIDLDDLSKFCDFVEVRDKTNIRGASTSLLEFLNIAHSGQLQTDVVSKLAETLRLPSSGLAEIFSSKFPGEDAGTRLSSATEIWELINTFDFKKRLGLPEISAESLYLLAEPSRPQGVGNSSDRIHALQKAAKKSLDVRVDNQESRYDTIVAIISDNNRKILTHYLLNQNHFRDLECRDPDSLFEYFLVDVQMGSSLKTSRIKQAISSVQLFVQRCLLGLEKSVRGVIINKTQWEWMRSYQLWEANRKLFLYPENWLYPTLRDDKSDIFKALEAKIMQTNLDMNTIASAVKDYIYSVNELADLGIQAYLWDTQTPGQKTMHLFARSHNAPYHFYHRRLDIIERSEKRKLLYWSSWTKMDIDVPTYEADAEGEALDISGSYLVPTIRRGRIFLFIPHILLKTLPTSTEVLIPSKDQPKSDESRSNVRKYWEMRMGWSELRNGVWSPKRVSHAKLNIGSIDTSMLPAQYAVTQTASTQERPYNGIDKSRLPSIDSFKFRVRSSLADGNMVANAKGIQDILIIDVESWYKADPAGKLVNEEKTAFTTKCLRLGRFEMRDYDFSAVGSTLLPTDNQGSNKNTLPTRFSRVEWNYSSSDEKDRAKWRPYDDHKDKAGGQPLLAKVTSDDKTIKERGLVTWTMSYDDTQFQSPTGLAVSFSTKERGNQSFLVFPATDLTTSTETGGVTEQIDNMVAPHLMERATSSEGLDFVFEWMQKMGSGFLFDAFGGRNGPVYHEQASPNAIYNWELGFHVVSLLMERLFATQQFEYALQVAHFVFDPKKFDQDPKSCWLFPPFADNEVAQMDTAEHLLNQLVPNGKSTLDSAILEWRAHPYAAHSIARNRPVAYMKRIVMTYIRILVASGDYYFRQNTLEAMHLAIQKYVEASHLFGGPLKKIPRIGKPSVQTFNSLNVEFNRFSNATLDMELEFPFMREPALRGLPSPSTRSEGLNRGLIGIFRSGYFCVPANPDLTDLKALIDDRLMKIRNGQDIMGKTVSRLLWEPSIDPGDLVRAVAAGKSASSVLADLDTPMPNYRFYYLLQKALELCGELKSMGDQLLGIREKRDAEALALFRQDQEVTVSKMMIDVKQLQLDEAAKSLEGLYETRSSHESRLSYYLKLIGEKDTGVREGKQWNDIEQAIETPTQDDLRMTSHEKLEMDSSAEAASLGLAASTLDTVASGLLALPKIMTNAEPMGVGASLQFDASNVAHFMMGTSSVMKLFAQMKNDQASRAGRTAQLVRQLQERRLQANMTGRDIVQLDKQIAAQKIRIDIAKQEINLQRKQVEQSQEMYRWYRGKYTSEALYAWMDNSVRMLYYETYQLTSELAGKAKKAFEFEKGRGSSNTSETKGYWDEFRDGLLSAQSLYMSLKKMELAYMEAKSHDYEITKQVSLRQIQPLALMALREKGETQFNIPEVLFDLDFPGHYLRRIRSVALTIPCIVGPYTSLNCTLDLLQHRCRVSSSCKSALDYSDKGPDDIRFRSDLIPISSIAVSQGQNDSGVFEVSFNGERYLPFEGAGVISTWRLTLPDPNIAPQFDYDTISDVIFHIKYTSCQGGITLKQAALSRLDRVFKGYAKEGSFYACLDLKNDYSNAWYSLIRNARTATGDGELKLDHIEARFPFWTKGKKIAATLLTLVVNHVSAACPTVTLDASPTEAFEQRDIWGDSTILQYSKQVNVAGTWTLRISPGGSDVLDLKRMFMIIEFKLL